MAADLVQLAQQVKQRALDDQFLANDAANRALELHLLQRAKEWTERAERDAASDPEIN